MINEKRLLELADLFDRDAVPGTLAPEEAAYIADLRALHDGAAAFNADTPAISDAQFPHFMAGIREQIGAPRPARFRFWTLASLATAALLLVAALLAVFNSGPEPVQATEVESATTEMDGATVDWYDGKEGLITVWVKKGGSDL